MATEVQQILEELKAIRSELDFIKEHMPNREMFLTSEEKHLLEESYSNEKKKKLTSSEELKKQLGI